MLKDLPSETRRTLLKAGITAEDTTAHLRVVLAILRFKTHIDFYLKSDYEKRPRIKPKRHNTGVSLVHPEIVSTADYPEEEAALVCNLYSRKDYKTSHQVGKGYVHPILLTLSPECQFGTNNPREQGFAQN